MSIKGVNLIGVVVIRWVNHIEIADWPIFKYVWFLNDNIIPDNIPINITNIIDVLNMFGNKIIWSGLIIHNNIDPNEIAIGLINMIGRLEYKFVWFSIYELNGIECLKDLINIRNEYEAVNPIDKKIDNVRNDSNFDEIIISTIMSLEK